MSNEKERLKSSQRNRVKLLSRNTRRWRRIHYYLGLSIALLLFISAATGLILSYKKDVVILQPPAQRGTSTNFENWLPLNKIAGKAKLAIDQHVHNNVSLDRMDVRPEKGIVKVLFLPGYWEVQIDGATGDVLSIAKRYSDLIEQIHDGSIINDFFKLISMNILGIGILILILSGLWLWYGPRQIRKIKHL